MLPKFVSEAAAMYHELRKRGTSIRVCAFARGLLVVSRPTADRLKRLKKTTPAKAGDDCLEEHVRFNADAGSSGTVKLRSAAQVPGSRKAASGNASERRLADRAYHRLTSVQQLWPGGRSAGCLDLNRAIDRVAAPARHQRQT